MPVVLSRQEIIEKAAMLPAFPRVVRAILETIENDTATIGGLAHLLEQDPVIAGRVVSLASSAAVSMRPGAAVHGVAGATSMIGLAKVKEIALTVGVAQFARGSGMSSYFWEHSAAVGVAAQELARYTRIPTEYALISGLLHDIGQLWMARFHPLEFQMVRGAVAEGRMGILEAERHYLGMDHCALGAIVAEYWTLPPNVVAAIVYHHDPDEGLDDPLVPVVHVAEVLSNALDLTRRNDNQVGALSEAACRTLGIDWRDDLNSLFGKIEARAEHACAVFRG